jgi:hypothetical protein
MFKKIIVLMLSVTITIHASSKATPTTSIPTETKSASTNASYIDWLAKPVYIAAFATLHLLTAPEPVRQNFINQLSRPNLANNFITQYLSWCISTLAHESGHAITQKLLTGTNSIVHLGSTGTPATTPLLTLGPISIDGINPTHGNTHTVGNSHFAAFLANYRSRNNLAADNLTPQQITNLLESREYADFKRSILSTKDNLIITAAGGICGLFAHHLAQKISTGELTFDHITANQLFNLLLPFNLHSDAAILWRNGAGIPDSIIAKICELAFFIDVAMEIYLAIKETTFPVATPLHSQILIGLINYNARGFLRFQA